MSVNVKVCGVTRPQDALAAINCGAAAIGLNFAPESPRYLTLEKAAAIVEVRKTASASGALWAGVFVNENPAEILRAVKTLRLDIVQLHGEETLTAAMALKQKLPSGTQVWRAFRVSVAEDLKQLWADGCDAWLLDAKAPGLRGGSGKSFDWAILAGLKRSRPLVLAGGLNPENVRGAVEAVHPEWIDVASGVESAPGIKDTKLIERFVQQASSPRRREDAKKS